VGLAVRAGHPSRFFAAVGSADGSGISSFVVGVKERKRSVLIERTGLALAGSRAFYITSGAERIKVAPPTPFFGVGTFDGLQVGAGRWSGTLGVALPGAEHVNLSGRLFNAGPLGKKSVKKVFGLLDTGY
jgi:hypothetical protein